MLTQILNSTAAVIGVLITAAVMSACRATEADPTGRIVSQVATDEVDVTSTFYPHVASASDVQVFDGDIYVLDGGDNSIKRFQMDGTFLNRIGEGFGEGPGELGRFSDFVVDGDTLWTLNPNRRRVSRFMRSGEFLDSFTIEHLNLRITDIKDGFGLLTYMEKHHISLIDRQGNKTGEITLDLDLPTPMWLSGRVGTLPDQRIIYVSTYGSYIIFISSDDESTHMMRTVDGHDFPTEVGTSSARGLAAPNPPVTNRRFSHDGKTLNVFTLFRDEEQIWIDRYDLESETYIGSIDVPCTSTRLVVNNDNMLCFEDERVLRYDLERVRRPYAVTVN